MSDRFTMPTVPPEGYSLQDEGPVLGNALWFGGAIGALALAIFVAVAVWSDYRKMALAALAIGGLPMAVMIIQVVRLKRKLGNARLFLPHILLPMGFSGTVTYLRPLREATVQDLEVLLQCREVLITGSGKNQRTQYHMILNEVVTPMTTPGLDELRVQVPLKIPAGGPASFDQQNAKIEWWLRFRLKMNGCPNTRSSFQLDIYPAVVQR